MRRMRWNFLAVSVGAVLFTASFLGAWQNKRVETVWVNTNFAGPPPTLREMALEADVVLFGRLIGASPRDAALKGGPPASRALTAYRLKITEVLQAFGGRSPEGEVTVIREGGDRDRGPFIVRTIQAGFPQFHVGDHYVMFLRWNETLSGWQPAWGPSSVFRINSGRVEIVGDAVEPASKYQGSSADEFLSQLRRLE